MLRKKRKCFEHRKSHRDPESGFRKIEKEIEKWEETQREVVSGSFVNVTIYRDLKS